MNRIRQLRESQGKPQKEIAIDLKVSQATISDWESGRKTPSAKSTIRLAKYFNVSVEYLLGLTGESEGALVETGKEELSSPQRAITRIPVLGTIPAGIPIEAIEDIVDWEEIPRTMTVGDKEYFGLKVTGNSMYPDYLEGDTIIVRKSKVCNSGDDCVVYVNGYDATLKRVKLGADGSITTLPRNPEYPPRTYSPKEVRDLPVSIAGVVVELRRKIK